MSKTTSEIHAARPLSPHLSIYRPQISSGLSIFHRISGGFLFIGMLAISWLIILYSFTDCKSCITHFAQTIIYKLFLISLSVAALLHLATGIRHLFWDMGYGFSIKAMNITGIIAICFTIISTSCFWWFIYG